MEPAKNPLPPREDAERKLSPLEKELPHSDDPDRAFNESLEPGDESAVSGIVDLLWDIRSSPQAAEQETPGSRYQCRECGHVNPQENRFCGMCGTARGVDNRYSTSPYLLVAIALLLMVISWRSGWDYGLRVGASTPSLPTAAKVHSASLPQAAEMKSSAAAMPAGERKAEIPPAKKPDVAAASSRPYRNELQGFNFYTKHLAPLRPGISQSAEVIRVLGDGSKLIGWRVVASYGTRRGRGYGPALGPLAEIVLTPEGVISMATVSFPAIFTHCRAVGGGFDVYRDGSGLEYWLYGQESQWGRKGDLYRIVYGPSKSAPGDKPTC